MIDIKTEKLLTLAEASRRLPAVDGRRVSLTTLWRWCTKGVGPVKVKLDHVRIGRRMCTTEEAVHRFMHECASAAVEFHRPEPPIKVVFPRGRTEKQRDAAIARAEADLEAMGMKIRHR